MHRVAVVTGDADPRRVVAGLVRCSEATHEAFATWCSTVSLGRDRDSLTDFPLYLRHWDALDRLVRDIPSP